MKDLTRTSIVLLAAILTLPMMGSAKDQVVLGVITAPADETLKSHLNLKHGLVVKDVAKGSPAEKTLRRSDILTKFDDQLLVNTAQLSALVGARKQGDEVVIEYLRGGKTKQSKVVLDDFEQPANEGSTTAVEIFPGMSIDRKHFDPSQFEKLGKQLENATRKLGLGAGGLELPDSAAATGTDASISINGQKVDIQNLLNNAMKDLPIDQGAESSSVSTSISSMTWNENGTVYQINSHNGRKTVKITENGEVKHEGDFNSEEDRAAVPENYLKRIDKIQGITNIANPKPEKSENE